MYDEPDNVRKLHIKPIPSLGGLGIFIGFIFCLLFGVNLSNAPEFQYYFASFLILFFIGLKDDILVLSATKKFIGQILVALILIFKSNLLITNIHGFLGLSEIDNTLSFLLTLFTIVVITNAFNLIDGIDGLAGSVGTVSSLIFGIFFIVNGNYSYAVVGFGMAASISAFLFYNFQPAKIFMGDTGSLLIGLVNSILVIKFIQAAPYYKFSAISASPAVGFCILLLPLMDTLRVFGIRILRGRSPFSPDRNHIHHLLLDKGLSHKNVTLTCTASAIFFAVSGFLLQRVGTTWLILGSSSVFFGVIYCLHKTRRRSPIQIVRREVVRSRETKEEKLVRVNSL
ncbi:MraY family glycosyltransferase [Segetibacter aerophilus]|uniref:Undecaprenyl-phosphate alpha-N-acetylglucosaminyl 1-phosphate transferase n=1 Tax=Segetibacter aerophilus TaxID=670293 RepID=A0A512BD72_9BACT|nr:MraY family glycosyltransferase [Segetibacter aerophilus]GEO09911.1 undecaprenyl-phosphate alpha-N-acetylglucosaminyl 1-phosphate transferase [Segetibacter aerophilus]